MAEDRFDFQRFDFHAKRFYFSESARVMTAEEVGQYLLLLVEAWMGSKDASLPDNPVLLARYARVQVVSEKVLAMFPVVETEHGPRRQNETLFGEWQAAVARSASGTAKAGARWGAKPVQSPSNAPALLVHTPGKSTAIPVPSPGPYHAGSGPGQTGPFQTNPSPSPIGDQGLEVGAGDRRALPAPALPGAEPTAAPDFKTFRITWRSLIKKSLGHNKTVEAAYFKACEEYGADVVLRMLQDWATPRTVEWASTIAYPYGAFIKQLSKLADRATEDAEEERAAAAMEAESAREDVELATIPAATPVQLAQVDSNIALLAAEEKRKRDERRKRFTSTAPVVANEGNANEYVPET